jgi:hypothetical protein
MSSHSWSDVWKLFLDLLSHESVAIQIAMGLGAAFVAVMALEGIRASFFPKRILEGAALRNAAPPAAAAPIAVVAEPIAAPPSPEQDMRAALWSDAPEPVIYSPLPRITVNSDTARRSSPRRLRVIGARKPS